MFLQRFALFQKCTVAGAEIGGERRQPGPERIAADPRAGQRLIVNESGKAGIRQKPRAFDSIGHKSSPAAAFLPALTARIGGASAAGNAAIEKRCGRQKNAIVPEALAPVRGWRDAQRALWEARLDRIDAYVAKLMKEPPNGT
jgi:hypothetical protein